MIIFSGHVSKVESRRDRSVKVTFETAGEVTDPQELAKLFSVSDHPVSIGIKEGVISTEEAISIPEPEKDFRGEKSPGQRLRGVMYRWWEQNKKGEFESFYRSKMESLIDQIKEKLT